MLLKSGKDVSKLAEIIDLLADDKKLDAKFLDHPLKEASKENVSATSLPIGFFSMKRTRKNYCFCFCGLEIIGAY
jgi:hypothetical protein